VRGRLLVLVLGLVAGVLAALEVPLAVMYAQRTSLDLFVTQLTDTTRFATLAEPALREDRPGTLDFEVRRYDQLYDVAVLVVDREGQIVLRSRSGLDPTTPALRSALDTALAGRPAERPHVAWPWDDRPYVVAEPVGRDNQVSGAVVTVGPTSQVRGEVLQRLTLLVGGGLVALALAALLFGIPTVRWVLRPVARLAGAAAEISRGRLDARVRDDVGTPELRRLTSAFNTMADSVERALDRQRFFVSQASHQLRNPLTALRLRVEMLGAHVTPSGAEEHRHAVTELDHLGELLDALLRLAGTDARRAERAEVDAAAVARGRVAAWRPAYERAGTPLRLTAPADGPVVSLIPDVLDQVLDALLDNALKFAPGSPVHVTVDAREVTVTDAGQGLSADDLAHVGERFWRSRSHQNVAGTGLGMAIAVALVEACGGRLLLERAEPHGLRARIVLPGAVPATGAVPAIGAVPATGAVPPTGAVPTGAPAGTSAPPPDAGPAGTSRSPSAPTAAAPPGAPAPGRRSG
jgi:signal transduction histidine kinase